MKRPEPKDFNTKDFLNGKYEEALEAYIDYLEKENNDLQTQVVSKEVGMNLLENKIEDLKDHIQELYMNYLG